MVFDCFGAGQLTTQHVFEGMTWRNTPSRAPQIFEVFLALRVVQEVRYHLAVTVWQNLPPALSARLAALQASADALVDSSPAELTQQAAHSLRAQASPVFREVSAALRPPAHLPSRLARRVRPRADLLGADLSGLDLTGVDLHGSLLIASDLSQARLHLTDLLGADLRDADLGGADLRTALFLTQPQVNAAQGNADTLLPVHLTAPSGWTVAP